MNGKQILVAGVGNIFLGDDAFGVEVIRELLHHDLPSQVRVVDFGIRSYDLAYAFMDDYTTVILVDATQRGQPPGTLYLIEPDLSQLQQDEGELVNAHSLNPVRVLQMVKAMGGEPKPLFLVACEPAVLESEDGALGLSEIVKSAVPEATHMIEALIGRLLAEAAPCTNSA